MASNSKDDINNVFGEMLSQWEQLTNQIANQVMSTSQFGKGQDAALNASLKVRETIHEQMTRFLEATNMPNREEVTELRSTVGRMDVRLIKIERMLEELVEQGQGSATLGGRKRQPMPPRTRKPKAAEKSEKPASTKPKKSAAKGAN